MGDAGFEPYGETTLANAASVRELTRRLALAAAEAGGLRARLELAEAAQAALREDLERERQRADRESARAERERRTSERLEEELRTYRSKGFWERLFGDG